MIRKFINYLKNVYLSYNITEETKEFSLIAINLSEGICPNTKVTFRDIRSGDIFCKSIIEIEAMKYYQNFQDKDINTLAHYSRLIFHTC